MKIPKGWKLRSLEEVATIQTGLSKSATRSGESVLMPYLRVANVQAGGFDLTEIKEIDVPKHAVERFLVRKGDLLLTEGGDADKLGRGAVWGGAIENCVHQNHVFVVRPDRSVLDERFLALQTQAYHGRAYFRSCAKQSTNLASINSTQLRQFPTLLPTLREQQKVSEIVATWDEALEKLDALIAAKERRKQALMQQLLTGKRRLKSFAAKPWKKLAMGEVLERVFRPAQKGSATSALALVSIRRRCGGLFRRPDVLPSNYKTKDLHQLKSGDFLISKRQVVHGAWSVVEAEFDGTLVSKEYAILVNRAPDKLDMRFFGWLAQTPRLIRLARVASTGVHIEKLIFDPDVFLRETIRVPSDPNEQAKIAEILDTASAEIDLLQKQRAALNLQKRGLMQRLLTGKIRTTP